MRSILSPAFTSSKIRVMVPFMVEVAKKMVGTLKEDIEKSRSKFLVVKVLKHTVILSAETLCIMSFVRVLYIFLQVLNLLSILFDLRLLKII